MKYLEMRRGLWVPLVAAMVLMGCMDENEYEEPVDTIESQDIPSPEDTYTPPEDTDEPVADVAVSDDVTEGDVQTPDEDIVAIEDTQTPEDTEANEDISIVEDVVEPPLDAGAPTVDITQIEDVADPIFCGCTFQLDLTDPVPQETVWLTGNWVNWAEFPEDGALVMALNEEGESPLWAIDVELEHGQAIEYKYRIKWPDAEEIQWCNQLDICEGFAETNSVFTVDCTQPCLLGP